MKGVTISTGTVSMHTYPVLKQGYSYRAYSKDYSVNMFLEPPSGLEPFFQIAADSAQHRARAIIYTPCVINRRGHYNLTYYSGRLLCPPNVNSKSRFFVPGLLIPDLKLLDIIEKKGQIRGYISISNYAGYKQFFIPPQIQIDKSPGIKFQGLIHEIPRDRRRRPVVIITVSSHDNEDVFSENSKTLEEIVRSPLKFWWNS